MATDQITVMKIVLLGSSLLTIGALASEAYRDNFSGEWRSAQWEYSEALVANADTDAALRSANAFVIEPKQIFLRELRTVDRCVTCHVGIENPTMADAEQPLRAHPGRTLKLHPSEKFGCTICHQGQGRATTRGTAHGHLDTGEPVRHTEHPLLRGDAIYTSCGRCHYELDLYGGQADLYAGGTGSGADEVTRPEIDRASLRLDLPGVEVLAEGKRLMVESGCLGCHKYRGGGGDLGADLTHIGDKEAHDFDFTHVKGEHTVQQWLSEHFESPATISPGTVMPPLDLTPEQNRSLTLFVMSLHRKSAPASHTPRPRTMRGDADRAVTGEELFKMFCAACHGPTGAGDGPAAATIGTRPRNFLREPFRYVSTMEGVATDEDLRRTIATGRGIEEMPSDPQFTDTEVRLLIDFLRSIRLRGVTAELTEAFADDDDIEPEEIEEIALERVTPGEPLVVPARSPDFKYDAAAAATIFADNCASCHGPTGRGDGPQELLDTLGNPIRARNLTTGRFHGGSEPTELFKRFRIGIPGTPMPAQEALSDDQVWQLVRFVLELPKSEQE